MGNNISCVQKASARNHREDSYIAPNPTVVAPAETKPEASPSAVQHILDREMQDNSDIPSDNAQVGTLFLSKSMTPTRKREREQRKTTDSPEANGNLRWSKKFSSCSTIFLDDSTVSQPNLKNTLKCVALAIHFIVLNREGNRTIDIFDELKHPLTRDPVPHDYAVRMPEQSHIYRFLRMLFKAAQLTAECAIVTLIYLERLLKYAEVDLCPANWKRILLASIMLASKVWDDQAVWNVDYCQILRDLTVDDMNSLERDFLAHLDFNINVPSSVYAKYYFDLRLLAEQSGIALSTEPLTKDKAAKLEAFSSICAAKAKESYAAPAQPRRAASLETLHANNRRSIAILS